MVIENYSIICYTGFIYKNGDKCKFLENGSYKLQEFLSLGDRIFRFLLKFLFIFKWRIPKIVISGCWFHTSLIDRDTCLVNTSRQL